MFAIFHIYFNFYFLRGRGPLFEAWRVTFGPRATGWEPLPYTYWTPLHLHTLTHYDTLHTEITSTKRSVMKSWL